MNKFIYRCICKYLPLDNSLSLFHLSVFSEHLTQGSCVRVCVCGRARVCCLCVLCLFMWYMRDMWVLFVSVHTHTSLHSGPEVKPDSFGGLFQIQVEPKTLWLPSNWSSVAAAVNRVEVA
jgi:hypothetical protein